MAKKKPNQWNAADGLTLDDLERIGYQHTTPLEPTPAAAQDEPKAGFMRRMADVALSAGAKGVIGVGEAAVGGADLMTGGHAGKFLEDTIGYRPKEAREFIDTQLMSDASQAEQRKFQQADGVLDKTMVALKNPWMLINAASESAPSMVGGAGVARGLLKVVPRLGPIVAGAIGEGAIGAGQSAEQIRQQSEDGTLSTKQTLSALGSGAGTALLGALGGKVAKTLGLSDVDTMLVKGSLDAGVRKNIVRATLEGAVSEGLLEELPQSIQEQVWQNYATNRPLSEGVDDAAVMGALTGGLMGGGANIVSRQRPEQPTIELLPENGPLSRAVNTGIKATAATMAAQGIQPVGITPEQEAAAMGAMEQLASDDQKQIKDAGRADKTGLGGMQATQGMQPEQQAMPTATVTPDQPWGDRLLTIRDQFGDESVRQRVRDQFGDQALGDAMYYAQAADNPEIPEKTRERMLSLAERVIAAAHIQPIDVAGVGSEASAKQAALPGSQQNPRLGMDTSPTGTMLADEQGNVRGETRVEKVSREQEARRKADIGLTPDVESAQARMVRPGDITRPNGEPFKNRAAANIVQKKQGGAIVEVVGGFVVRQDTSATPTATTATMGTKMDVKAGPGTTAADVMQRFHPDTGTKGIPRAEMPQIQSEHHGALTNFLNARGIAHETGEVDPNALKPTQAEYSQAKVEKAKESPTDRSIIVSNDGHVLDGHHQWLAAKEQGEPVKAIMFDAPIDKLLDETHQFPSTETANDQNQAAPVSGAQTEGQAQQEAAAPAKADRTGRAAGLPSESAGDTTAQTAGVTAPVRLFGSTGYQLTMADAVKKVAELEKDARESKKRANGASTKVIQKIEDDASARAASLARQLRNDIKALADGYPDARQELEVAKQVKSDSEVAQPKAKADGVNEQSKPARKVPKKVQEAQEAREAKRADYFTPGNIVKSSSGQHDRVIEYTKPDVDGRWSVRVRAVKAEQGRWVDHPLNNKERTHSTEPNATDLKNGPVVRATLADREDTEPVLHKDPGEPAEQASPEVIAESLRKAAAKEDRKPSEMKADLLAQVDAAMDKASEEEISEPYPYDLTEAQIRQAKSDLGLPTKKDTFIALLKKRGDAAQRIGYVTFDVAGDGVFKVLNTKSYLKEFRDKVEKSPGFKDKVKSSGIDGATGSHRGSASSVEAIKNMIDEGDAQAAVDYAASKEIVLSEALKGDAKRLAKIAGVEPSGEAEAVEPAAPAHQASEFNAQAAWDAMTPAARGAMLDKWAGAGQTDMGERYKSHAWGSFNAGEKDTLTGVLKGEQEQATDDRDTFTLKRLNRNTNKMESVTFKRGEYIRHRIGDKDNFGEIDGISQVRREFSVDGLWYPMGFANKAERPAAPERKGMVPLSKVIDKVNAKSGEGLTDADRVPEQSPASKTPTLDKHTAVIKAVRAGTSSVDDYQSAFDAMVGDPESIKAELNTLTKESMLRAGGAYFYQRYKSETKADVIKAMYDMLVNEYALGKEYGPTGYMMGARKGYDEAKAKALRDLVEGLTAETLADFAAEVKAAQDEDKAEQEAKESALKNPQSLGDFRTLIRKHVMEGKTRKEAFLMLTPEQRIKYDELEAEGTKEAREARKRAQKTEVRAAGQTTGGEIIATKHTRDGYDLFVVKLADRLSKEDYTTVLASAKKLGGWYSAFRGNGAIPGFQFKDKANAEAFLKLAGGDTTDAQAQAEQRRDAFEDDRSQTVVERLRTMADKLAEQASEIENADRKTNTVRRARFAASALKGAAEMKAKAATMRNIAQSIEDGNAKFLDSVRTKSQVDMLTGIVATAKNKELRAKHESYADQEKRRLEPATAETADFAEFPTFTAYRSDLASLARRMLEVEGTKKLGQQLMKVADDVTGAYLDFAKEPANLHKLSTFSMRRGDEVKAAIFASRDLAERAINRSGLTGKAIVLAEKRGVNRIIMSPSEAINAGIWTGDGDKRITLTAESGNELVGAIGRRGNKSNNLSVPWQFQNAHDELKALARIGIETPSELRSALREFIGLQERAISNKVREMELKMVGRKADGLDFFPTPDDVADQMVEAAELTPEMAVLEPSAGMGHIADRIRAAGAEPDVIELSGDRRELLQEKGYHVADVTDFMDLKPRDFFTFGDVFEAPDGTKGIMHGGKGWSGRASLSAINEDGSEGRFIGWFDRDELKGVAHRGGKSGYDRIIMNPPFSNRRDAEHVRHAYDLLKPGGRIVAIMGEGVFFGQDKKAQDFRDWLESVGGTDEKLPAGSFNDPSLPVNTGVNARLVVIDKPESPTKFKRSAQTTYGDEVSSVKSIVSEITSKWKNAPDVVVIGSMSDAPESVQRDNDKALAMGADSNPSAFYSGGKVYLIASEMNGPQHVVETLLHEVLGHHGLQGAFGESLKPILQQLWVTRRRAVEDKYIEYGLDANSKADRLIAAEEVLADMAQTDPRIGFVRRAVAAIRAWLRQHVPGFSKMAVTDDEIVSKFLVPARNWVERGGRQTPGNQATRYARSDAESNALSELSKNDELFALPKSDKTTVEGITKDNDPSIQVKQFTLPNGETVWVLTMPDGRDARITARKPNKYGPSPYGADFSGESYSWDTTRPGENPEYVDPEKVDVWLDVSNLTGKGQGATIYNIASTFAHNTGAMFIGDPSGVSADAMRRRPVHMLSSALKFGTTEHLAPHPEQTRGSKEFDIPALKWVYGDHLGNIRRLIDLNLKLLDNEFPASKNIQFDVNTGQFTDATTGQHLSRDAIGKAVTRERELAGSGAAKVLAGSATAARGSVLRALLRETGSASAVGDGRRNDLLAQLVRVGSVHPQSTGGIFYSRAGGLNFADALGSINQQSIRDNLADFMGSAGAKVSWWEKSIGTQYAKAERHPEFKPVFDAVQQYVEDTSSLANGAADHAPNLLPKLDTWKDLTKGTLSNADTAAIAAPIFEGTLTEQRVFDDDELRSRYKLNDRQIGLYKEFRETVNDSLDQVVAADVLRLLGDVPQGFKSLAVRNRGALQGMVDQFLTDQMEKTEDDGRREELKKLKAAIDEKYARAQELKDQGYAPLMRFGKFLVNVRDNQTGESLFFGLYENRMASNRMARTLAEDPEFKVRGTIQQGVLSQEQHKLFAGVPLESMEMFAQAIGADQSEVFQQYLKLVKNNRSAMKRLIKRNGTAGFSQDVQRVLAAFVTSNARLTAGGLNMPQASKAAQEIKSGDVKDEAVKLIDTVQNPTETAAVARSLLFMNFIGGSAASAIVNLTQPITMTAPYLSQWGGMRKAGARLIAAAKDAATGRVAEPELAKALKRAEDDGIVSPQEIHHLQAEAMGSWGTHPLMKKAAFIWGSMFSLAEQFNRRVTFIAAYRTAKEQGIENPFEFAEKAVVETQGLYNVGNRANWARNPVGATVLTFKQFSTHYLEWFMRMWRSGPEGKKAAVYALAILMLAAGADGLPFADDLDDFIDTLAQAMGYDFSAKRAKQKFVAETLGLGDDAAEVFTRGLSSVPGIPIDVSMRMSMGNLIPATGLFLKSNTDRSRDVMEVGGAAGALAKQYIDVGEKLLQGDLLGAGKVAMPVALQSAAKGLDIWQTGEYRDTKGRRVMDADTLDGLMKAVGFQPAEIAAESRKIGLEQRRIGLAKAVEAEIADQWANGMMENDQDMIQAARDRLMQWNNDNPRTPIAIGRAQLISRVREMKAGRTERFIKTAPKEIRGSVAEAIN